MQQARVTHGTSGDQKCGDKSTSSPSPPHAHQSERQMPRTEGERTQRAEENSPPQHEGTRDCQNDPRADNAKPTPANQGPRSEEASPPSPPRQPEAQAVEARAVGEDRPPRPTGADNVCPIGSDQPEDPSLGSLTPLTDTRWTALLEAAGLGSHRAEGAEPSDREEPILHEGQLQVSDPHVGTPEVDPAQPAGGVPAKGRPTMPVEDPFRPPPEMALVTNGGQGLP